MIWSTGSILDYGNESDALHNGADGISNTNVERYNKVILSWKQKERYLKLFLYKTVGYKTLNILIILYNINILY